MKLNTIKIVNIVLLTHIKIFFRVAAFLRERLVVDLLANLVSTKISPCWLQHPLREIEFNQTYNQAF